MTEVYVFDAKLEAHFGVPLGSGPVTRTLALPASQTLIGLHRLIQEAFEWDGDHLYSFWLDGKFWGDNESEYSAPFELEERGAKSARVRIDRRGLQPGQRIAYLFDFDDEWRLSLKLRETREGGETGILESQGEAPPQYPDYEDEE